MTATMLAMPSQLQLYEEVSLLSARMVEAARASDWDKLIELENSVASLRNILMTTPEDYGLPTDDVNRKRSLIQSILENDAEVRRHTEPWMEQLQQLIGVGSKQRKMERAYSAMSGYGSTG
jgi:flagellar protein FliT